MKSGQREIFRQTILIVGLSLFLTGLVLAGDQPDSETCLGCHDDMSATLAETAHSLGSAAVLSATVECVSCHTGGSVHVEDPSVENIGNPTTMEQVTQLKLCITCHEPHIDAVTFGLDPHVGQDLACTSCHTVHSGTTSLLYDSGGAFCSNCHISAANDFKKRSNHPLIDGIVNCINCHDLTSKMEPGYGHGPSANCRSCHPETSGPFMYEHDATSSFATEGAGCIACHSPHGSSTDRLVVPNTDRLCQQCHPGETGHSQTAHNGQYAGNSCIDCHSEIHGSFEPGNKLLLDPNLGAKLGGSHPSCYCHKR